MKITAKYDGTCAETGRRYDAGTKIEKTATGKWKIAGEVVEMRSVRINPLAVEFGGDGVTVKTSKTNVAIPMWCSCIRSRPDFDIENEAMRSEAEFVREGDSITCPRCGRTGEILPKETPKPEVRTCWECGCEFTYADCKRNDGDWGDNYCGC